MTETALGTALNMSYMAEQLAIFGIVVGFALLLSGVGFIVLALGGVAPAPRVERRVASLDKRDGPRDGLAFPVPLTRGRPPAALGV